MKPHPLTPPATPDQAADDPRAAWDLRLAEMRAERIIAYSPSLNRWCVCNGFARILATAGTQAEAEALRHAQFSAEQLNLI